MEQAVTAALDATEKKEKMIHSFVTVDREGALRRARKVQRQIDEGCWRDRSPEYRRP